MLKLFSFLIALAAIVAATASSFSGSMTLLGVGKAPGGGGGGSLTYNYVATVTPNNAGALNSPVTFTGASIGTASSDRIVVVTFGNYKAASSASGDFSGVSMECITATKTAGETVKTNQPDDELW